MKCTIDLTDDVSYHGDGDVSEPASLSMEGDEVVMQLREVELRMTLQQFIRLTEAQQRWLFRDMRGELDINDEEWCAELEHEKLRKIFRGMVVDGTIGCTQLPREVVEAMMLELNQIDVHVTEFVFLQNALMSARQEVAELKTELSDMRKRQRKAKS